MSSENISEQEYIADEEVNLLDYLAVIVKYRRMIFYMCTTAVIVAVIVSLLLPKIYSATAVIMPPKSEQGTMASLASRMGGITALAGGIMGGSSPSEVYVEMLKSRVVKDTIIDRFNLLKVYDVALMKVARENLKNNTLIKTSKADTISVEVEDKDPQRAADMANAYVKELDKLSRKLTVSDAARQRMFLEKRIEGTEQQLSQAEEVLKEFREKNKIVSLPAQASSSIYGAARIKGEIISIETELEVLKNFATEKSNKIVRLEKELEEMKDQLIKIETGQGFDNSDNPDNQKRESNFYIPFTQLPNLGLQLSRLMRNVKVKETVYELLTEQYELAKIAESKDMATIQILDEAVVPEKRSKPRRGLIVVLTGVLSFFASIFLAFTKEYFARMNDEDQKRWQDMKAAMRGDFLLRRNNSQS